MITSAAIKVLINDSETVILRCHRHCDAFETLKLLHIKYDKNSVKQGFINWNYDTHEERFISREEAYQIAMKEGQLKEQTETPGQLFSEDLY